MNVHLGRLHCIAVVFNNSLPFFFYLIKPFYKISNSIWVIYLWYIDHMNPYLCYFISICDKYWISTLASDIQQTCLFFFNHFFSSALKLNESLVQSRAKYLIFGITNVKYIWSFIYSISAVIWTRNFSDMFWDLEVNIYSCFDCSWPFW